MPQKNKRGPLRRRASAADHRDAERHRANITEIRSAFEKLSAQQDAIDAMRPRLAPDRLDAALEQARDQGVDTDELRAILFPPGRHFRSELHDVSEHNVMRDVIASLQAWRQLSFAGPRKDAIQQFLDLATRRRDELEPVARRLRFRRGRIPGYENFWDLSPVEIRNGRGYRLESERIIGDRVRLVYARLHAAMPVERKRNGGTVQYKSAALKLTAKIVSAAYGLLLSRNLTGDDVKSRLQKRQTA